MNVNKKEGKRETWGHKWHFLFTAIGYVVGLGNIWRFPNVAFQNGGGSFIIVYIFVSILFGLPTVFLELSLGQFSRAGPAHVYGWIAPVFKGLGYAMILANIYVCTYYNIIIAWIIAYLVEICSGNFFDINHCENDYNTFRCCSIGRADNRSCESIKSQYAAVEYYNHYILKRTSQPGNFFGGFSWEVLLTYGFGWIVVFLVLHRGMNVLGRVSYIVTPISFIIVAILFILGVTLDGCDIGLLFFYEPDFSRIFDLKTWKAAMVQNVYSLSLSTGSLVNLSSYNKRSNNIFAHTCIIVLADTIMSLVGGMAIYSILGHMSLVMDRDVEDVLADGFGLAFIAFPTAISEIYASSFIGILFFLMLMLIGFGSMFGDVEAIIAGITDTWPFLRRYRAHVVGGTCFFLFLFGCIGTTTDGIFYVKLFDDYSLSISFVVGTILEYILVAYVYGTSEFFRDLRTMLGNPKSTCAKIFGPTGYYIAIAWLFIAPTFAMGNLYYTFVEHFKLPWTANCMKDGKDSECDFTPYMYFLAGLVAWSPLIVVLVFAIIRFVQLYIIDRLHILDLIRPGVNWQAFYVRKVLPSSYNKRTFIIPLVDEVPDPIPESEDRKEVNEFAFKPRLPHDPDDYPE